LFIWQGTVGSDDAFHDDTELKAVTIDEDEKDRLVHFEDEEAKKSKGQMEDKGQAAHSGQGDASNGEVKSEETPKDDTEKQLLDDDKEPKV
jgi:hypothetical protein